MLTQEKCVACRRDSPLVTQEEVVELRPEIPDWDLTSTDGIDRLQRAFKFGNFADALEFAGALGRAADAEGHHPRLTVEWGRVGVDWWTHKIRGLHHTFPELAFIPLLGVGIFIRPSLLVALCCL